MIIFLVWFEGATPKAVLRIMGVQGITIYHVKSHLQKYRLAKYMPEISEETRAERRRNDTYVQPMGISSSQQITQALQMQMEVQKRLHEQLEVPSHNFLLIFVNINVLMMLGNHPFSSKNFSSRFSIGCCLWIIWVTSVVCMRCYRFSGNCSCGLRLRENLFKK
jgi:hypothetical protein